MNEMNERSFDWDDTIEHDSQFVTLPEGDYDFEVTEFERARHPGSEKLPPCNKAIIHLRIHAPQGTANIQHNLFLHSKCEGMLCAFFTAIGQRKHGEKLKMNWSAVVGAKGRCKLGIRTYTNKNGETGTANEIRKFYEPDPSAPAQPLKKFTPGAF